MFFSDATNIKTRPTTLTKVVSTENNNVSITCSAQSVYKMAVEWGQIPTTGGFNDFRQINTVINTQGNQNTLQSTINFNITRKTPYKFNMECRVITYFIEQHFNYRQVQSLKYRGAFFQDKTHYYTYSTARTQVIVKCKCLFEFEAM